MRKLRSEFQKAGADVYIEDEPEGMNFIEVMLKGLKEYYK
jgi:hypothetical protein